ncbi:biopolymer transport protein ExbB [Balnearium lithotrophicum]|uniref:Biopolymer transport protein ExbB n=1 Tax=Balnearium lithotrophicum TaxID=223788 RepID=A0A521BN44_9BACT|nr:MotA/TolQ/ExbB proton channel family protein [Balnearium lithotrophicum]SMO48532.1 biopolymer transport protein ExbB [Balnearium lithotrophicum]
MIPEFSILQKGGVIVYIILLLSFLVTAFFIERLLFLLIKVRKFKKLKSSNNCFIEFDQETEGKNIDDILENYRKREESSLYKYTEIFPFTAEVSPMLGLLGTVLGLIKSFMAIEAMGGKVNVSALSAGMWEALLTTAVGLTVSIFAVSFQEVVQWLINKVELELEEFLNHCRETLKKVNLNEKNKEA